MSAKDGRSALMKKLLLTLALGALVGVGLAIVAALIWRAQVPQIAIQQPTLPPPVAQTGLKRSSLTIILALACTCNLSAVALFGSVVLMRRMKQISPDPEKKQP